ncbi:hypothetical protein KAH37_04140, partial [bacterium]|nr:hypothetical protein [bacterium]
DDSDRVDTGNSVADVDSADTADSGSDEDDADTADIDSADSVTDADADSAIDPEGDEDSDGIKNKDEMPGGLPVDSDSDTVPDYLDNDSDNDGLSDGEEVYCSSLSKESRLFADSDGDGFSDLVEAKLGSDLCDDASTPEGLVDFYFVLDDATAQNKDMVFSPTIKKSDVWFHVDTTGSMGGEITTLKSDLSVDIIPAIRAKITDSAFGVAWFNDPLFGISIDPTTNPTEAQVEVDKLAAGVPGSGGDCEEEGYKGLEALALADSWREDTFPLIVHITDAPSKPGRDGAINALIANKIKVISVMSSGGCGDPSDELIDLSQSTGAVAPVCANAGGVGVSLKYDVGGDGSGLATAVINGVDAILKYAVFDLYADAIDGGGNSVDMITKMEAVEYIGPADEPEKSCVQDAIPATFNGTVYNNGFQNFSPGTALLSKDGAKLKFKITAKNDTHAREKHGQSIVFQIQIIDKRTGLRLDRKSGMIIIPAYSVKP